MRPAFSQQTETPGERMRMGEADICLLLEGTYPYVLGGVSGWMHALIEATPHLTFHVLAILAAPEVREPRYPLPPNVIGVSHVYLDLDSVGYAQADAPKSAVLEEAGEIVQRLLLEGELADFAALLALFSRPGIGPSALLDSRAAWRMMEKACLGLLPTAPLVDFFWTWRVLLRSILAVSFAPLPPAKAYHSISTGYAGLLGARAKLELGRPYVITEHGIYTNERRIEIGLADWLFDSGSRGYGVDATTLELRDLWLRSFSSLARIAYAAADAITTLYKGNQSFQRADGAPDEKLRVIPNGIDFQKFSSIERSTEPRRPTIAFIGRVVPIKDVRTFIFACAALRKRVPDVEALILGPEDEDPEYAAECRRLVEQEELQQVVRFMGRVDITRFLGRTDVIVLTSVSEAQPLVLLEAGAAGVPCVATDVGSCRDILEGFEDDPVPGAGGCVVSVGDSQAAAEALARILRDEELRASMSAVLRRRVQSFYNKVRIDRVYHELYDTMLARAVEPVSANG